MSSKSDFPKLKSKAILAPMAGVTNVAFRTLCKKFGAGMTVTELTSSKAIIRDNVKSLEIDSSEKPVCVQLFGDSVDDVVNAAKRVQDFFDVIDINCGCPVHKVIKRGAGSALLKDPNKIASFVNKLVSNINKPITIKIRTGISKNFINAVEVAKLAEDAGASAIAVHGRTQKQAYSGNADWNIIKQVKDAVNIPVIGNGDVNSPEVFKKRLDESGVDYIMIGRAANSNPLIFKQVNEFLKKGTYKKEFPITCFPQYLELATKYNIHFGVIKSQAMSLTKGIEGSAKLRRDLALTKTIEELLNRIKKTNLF